MREPDLQRRMRRRYVVTPDSDRGQPIFSATGFVYVAVILDARSRRVVGYAISRSIDVWGHSSR